MKTIDDEVAERYARWFQGLADATRIKVLNVVAQADHPLTVGEIVEVVGKSQSTVSRHLQVLAEQGYVFAQRDGVRTLIRVNESCMTALPAAAAEIMAASR